MFHFPSRGFYISRRLESNSRARKEWTYHSHPRLTPCSILLLWVIENTCGYLEWLGVNRNAELLKVGRLSVVQSLCRVQNKKMSGRVAHGDSRFDTGKTLRRELRRKVAEVFHRSGVEFLLDNLPRKYGASFERDPSVPPDLSKIR